MPDPIALVFLLVMLGLIGGCVVFLERAGLPLTTILLAGLVILLSIPVALWAARALPVPAEIANGIHVALVVLFVNWLVRRERRRPHAR